MRGRYTESIQLQRHSLEGRQSIICKVWVELWTRLSALSLSVKSTGDFSSDSAIGRIFFWV